MTKVTHQGFMAAVESSIKVILSGKVPLDQRLEFVDPDGKDRKVRLLFEELHGGDVVLTIVRQGEFSPVVEIRVEYCWVDTYYIVLDGKGFENPNVDTRIFQLKLLVELEKVYA